MEPLGREELVCLTGVAANKVKTEADCSPGVLLHLQQQGLVLQRPQRSMPLGNRTFDYTLSPAGKMMLERARSRN